MANDCHVSLAVVAADVPELDEFRDVLFGRYGPDRYLYRVYRARTASRPRVVGHLSDGRPLHMAKFRFDVAWSAENLFAPDPYLSECGADRGMTTLPELCEKLVVGVELWANEPHAGFQQHGLCDRRRNVEFERRNWPGRALAIGGIAGYGNFLPPVKIYEGVDRK